MSSPDTHSARCPEPGCSFEVILPKAAPAVIAGLLAQHRQRAHAQSPSTGQPATDANEAGTTAVRGTDTAKTAGEVHFAFPTDQDTPRTTPHGSTHAQPIEAAAPADSTRHTPARDTNVPPPAPDPAPANSPTAQPRDSAPPLGRRPDQAPRSSREFASTESTHESSAPAGTSTPASAPAHPEGRRSVKERLNNALKGVSPKDPDRLPAMSSPAQQEASDPVSRALHDAKGKAAEAVAKKAADVVPGGTTSVNVLRGAADLKRGNWRRAAKKWLEALVAGVLMALGVPPNAAEKLSPWVVRAVAVLLVFSLLVSTALFGMLLGGGSGLFGNRGYLWNVQGEASQLDIPESYMSAYQDAARDSATNVPWTVIAAAGAVGTYHGRVNPYLQSIPSVPVPESGGQQGYGLALGGGTTVWPTKDAIQGAQFNQRGELWSSGRHTGLDFRGGQGVPVFATADGTVTHAGPSTSNSWAGNYVVISHGDGVETWYAHLSATSVRKNQPVSAGVKIGEIGNTGNTSKPGGHHLHFEVRLNGRSSDPLEFLSGAALPTADVASMTRTASGMPRKVYAVGDEMSVDTSSALKRLLSAKGIVYDDTLSRKGFTLNRLKDALASNPPSFGSAVVLTLGTRDDLSKPGAFARQLKDVIGLFGSDTTVYVPTVLRPGAEVLNAEISALAAEAAFANVIVVPWAEQAAALGVAPVKTAPVVALAPDGYVKRADAIARAISERAAAAGTAGSIVNVSTGAIPPVALSGPGVMPTPEGRCPVLPSSVQGASRNQGAGPLMLSPAKLEGLGITVTAAELQNVCTSADVLAKAMRITAEAVAVTEGMQYPNDFYALRDKARDGDRSADAKVQKFWSDVVNQMDVFGEVAERRCSVPAQDTLAEETTEDWVSSSITEAWNCVLADTPLNSLAGDVDLGKLLNSGVLPVPAARARAVKEALEVAWGFSRWGTAACDATATAAGVFPVTQAQFDKFVPERLRGTSRCDTEANILTAARMFREGEKTLPATRPAGASGWGAAYGGWAQFGDWVTGPKAVRNEFLATGPRTSMYIAPECITAASTFLMKLALQSDNPYRVHTARVLQNYVNADTELPNDAAFDAWLGANVRTLSASTACKGFSGRQWLGVLNQPAGETGIGESDPSGAVFLPASIENLDQLATPGVVLAAMRARIADRFNATVSTTIQPGKTALVQRISPSILTGEEAPSPARPNSPTDMGIRLVELAIRAYGGLWPEGAREVAPGLVAGIPSGGALAAAAVQLALSKVGRPYVSAARGPDAFDCSGLTYWAYKKAGLEWNPMTSYEQWWPERFLPGKKRFTIQIPADQVQNGDLVFYDTCQGCDKKNPIRSASGRAGVDHVGIVIDAAAGKMVHAANPNRGVVIASIDSQGEPPIGYARVIDPDAPAAWAPGEFGDADPASPLFDGKIVVLDGCKNQLANFLYQIGWRGENIREAWAIAMRESGGRFKERIGPGHPDFNGADYGLFQFNEYHRGKKPWWPGPQADARVMDGAYNAKAAFKESNGGKTWVLWGLDGKGRENAKLYRGVGWSEERIQDDIVEPYEEFYRKFPCAQSV